VVSKTIIAEVIGSPKMVLKNAAMPIRIKTLVSICTVIALRTEPIPEPIARAGAIMPPAHPEAKVIIVLAILAITS
jgi:hypothetical protein